MKIDIRKTNPIKYRLSTLIAIVVLAHIFSLLIRDDQPAIYKAFESLFPFSVVILTGVLGTLIWLWSMLTKTWAFIQTSLLVMALFFAIIDASLLYTHSWNGAIMWTGAVFVCLFTYKMRPVYLMTEKPSGK